MIVTPGSQFVNLLQLLHQTSQPFPVQLTNWFAALGCAFVQFRKWAEAEAAIDMHNAKTVLPGAEVPLVVKFADARKKDGFANGMKRGILADPWADKRQLGGGVPDAFLQVCAYHRAGSHAMLFGRTAMHAF